MPEEQELLHWLIGINSVSDDEIDKYKSSQSASTIAAFLAESGATVETMLDFIDEHYDDRVQLQPMLSQILLALQRGGPLRVFALQFVPTVMHAYLIASSQPNERRKCVHLDAFLLSVYNHEIVERPGERDRDPSQSPDSLLAPIRPIVANPVEKPGLHRRVDVYRIPNMCQHSIYHNPEKLSQSILVDSNLLTRISPPSNTSSAIAFRGSMETKVTVGPYSLYTRMTCENRYIILSRLIRSIHAHLAQMHHASVLTSICDMVMCICRNGYALPINDLAVKVLLRVDSHQPGGQPSTSSPMDKEKKDNADNRRQSMRASGRSNTVVENMDVVYAGKPRITVHPGLLLELTHCVYYAVFNGYADAALSALDAVHQRSTIESFANVLLMTNAIINSLLENPSGGPSETTDPMGVRIVTMTYDKTPRRQLITNASLRMKRMPEDIPVIDNGDKTDGSGIKEMRGELAQAFRKKLVQLRPDSLQRHLHGGSHKHDDEKYGDKERSTPPTHHGGGGFSKLSQAQKRAKSRLLGLRSRMTDSSPLIEMNEMTSGASVSEGDTSITNDEPMTQNGDTNKPSMDTATITNAMVDALAAGDSGDTPVNATNVEVQYPPDEEKMTHIPDFSPRMLNSSSDKLKEKLAEVQIGRTDLSRLKHMDSSGDNLSDS